MTTNADRVIEALRRWPGLDDDALARQADVHPRQQVNRICRTLEDQGVLRRVIGTNGKIGNVLVGSLAQDDESLVRSWRGSGRALSDLPAALATFIYLRWVDFQESEQEAKAAFEGAYHERILHDLIQWRAWHNRPSHEIADLFYERLVPRLRRLKNRRAEPVTIHLHRLAEQIDRILRAPGEAPLGRLATWLAAQPFETPSDRRRLLAAYDTILDKSLDRSAGEHRTPKQVIDLMVALGDPRAGERVYDPAFGTGGLLTASLEHARMQEEACLVRRPAAGLSIAGVEIDGPSYIIGLARLVLAGVDDPQIELGDSLERAPARGTNDEGFDLILTNPPWGVRADRDRYRHAFAVPTRDVAGLFVQHALDQLRPEGRTVIVVPEGMLFQRGPEEQLRRKLLERDTVEAVVALPEGAFLPYTGLKANILLLRRNGPTHQVRLINTRSTTAGRSGVSVSTLDETKRILADLRASSPSADAWDVSAEALARLDWDLTVRRRDEGALEQALHALGKICPILPLGQLCGIISGRGVPGPGLLDEPAGDPLVPYVRIRDIRDGRAGRATSWVSPHAAEDIDTRERLRLGDVLLSRSGTIGKVGIAQNSVIGGLASQGLYVLRITDERLDPHFLQAYLDSTAARTWLGGLARGAVIQHLRPAAIEQLWVPLPPLSMQLRVADEHRERRVDALSYLVKLTSNVNRDSVADWAAKALNDYHLSENTPQISPLDLTVIGRFAEDVRRTRERLVPRLGPPVDTALYHWLPALSEALQPLRGVHRIPLGPSLFGVLQETSWKLNSAEVLLTKRSSQEAIARRLTRGIAWQLQCWLERLLSEVALNLEIAADELDAGMVAEVRLDVRNAGPLPLREILLTTTPDWGGGEIGFLSEGQTATLSLRGSVPTQLGPFVIRCEWAACLIDGRLAEGAVELPVRSVERLKSLPGGTIRLASSPYVCGDPVRPDRNDVFFGREELIDDIRRQVVRSGNVILLEGNRRAGKSSILRHLEGLEPIPGWLGVYSSLQGAEGSSAGVGVPTAEVFREIAKSIASSLRVLGRDVPLPNGTMLARGQNLGIAAACRSGISADAPFADLREYVETILAFLREDGRGLLMMLDEFDKLQEGIENGITSPQVPENIRFLVQTYPQFSAILTGSRRLKRLRNEYWSALFGLGTRFPVSALSAEAARRLVVEPVKDLLVFSDEAVMRAITHTACQPFLLQCLCSRIFELAAQLKQPSVTVDFVDRAAAALVADNEHFATLWDYAGSDRRRLILAICHREAIGPDSMRLGALLERLSGLGVDLDEYRLIEDLEFLRELEVLEKGDEASGGAYALAIPLMGLWINRQQDFEILTARARAQTEEEHV